MPFLQVSSPRGKKDLEDERAWQEREWKGAQDEGEVKLSVKSWMQQRRRR